MLHHHRRLGHLAAALAPRAAVAGAQQHESASTGVRVDQLLRDLQERKTAALEREDYSTVAQLHATLRCLTPRPSPPQPPPRDAPTDQHTAFLHEHGFTTIQLFEKGEELERLQAAWRRVQEPAVREWEEAKLQGVGIRGHGFANSPLPNNVCFAERGTPVTFRGRLLARRWMDIPAEDFFAEATDPAGDGILLDLIDHPLLVPLLQAYLGQEVQLAGVSPRTYPPNDTAADEVRALHFLPLPLISSYKSEKSLCGAACRRLLHVLAQRRLETRLVHSADGRARPQSVCPFRGHVSGRWLYRKVCRMFGRSMDEDDVGAKLSSLLLPVFTAVVPGSHKLMELPQDIFGSSKLCTQQTPR